MFGHFLKFPFRGRRCTYERHFGVAGGCEGSVSPKTKGLWGAPEGFPVFLGTELNQLKLLCMRGAKYHPIKGGTGRSLPHL